MIIWMFSKPGLGCFAFVMTATHYVVDAGHLSSPSGLDTQWWHLLPMGDTANINAASTFTPTGASKHYHKKVLAQQTLPSRLRTTMHLIMHRASRWGIITVEPWACSLWSKSICIVLGLQQIRFKESLERELKCCSRPNILKGWGRTLPVIHNAIILRGRGTKLPALYWW